MIDYKKIEIEFVRPININGIVARYHTFNDVETLYLNELNLDIRTSNFGFKCPLRLIKFLLYTN